MHEFFTLADNPVDLERESSRRKLIFRFLLTPESYSKGVLTCTRNRLEGDIFKQEAHPTSETAKLATDLLVSSIGFKSVPLVKSLFDFDRNTVRNENGCVVKNEKVDIGCYAVGWSKTGARGVIDTTLLECEETLNNIRIHL